MLVVNDHVGELLVTPHALERWAERGHPSPIHEVIKPALPFGGQSGSDFMLAHEQVVFVTRHSGRRKVVVTVLTMDQAVANMEYKLGKYLGVPHSAPKAKPLPVITTPIPALSRKKPKALNTPHKPPKPKTDVEQEIEAKVEKKYVKLFGMTPDGLEEEKKFAGGAYLHCVSFMLSMLKKKKSMEIQQAAVQEAAREFLPFEVLVKFWARVKEIEESEGTK